MISFWCIFVRYQTKGPNSSSSFMCMLSMQQMEKMKVLVLDTGQQNTSLPTYNVFSSVPFLTCRNILLHKWTGIL